MLVLLILFTITHVCSNYRNVTLAGGCFLSDTSYFTYGTLNSPCCDNCRRAQERSSMSRGNNASTVCTYDFAPGEEMWISCNQGGNCDRFSSQLKLIVQLTQAHQDGQPQLGMHLLVTLLLLRDLLLGITKGQYTRCPSSPRYQALSPWDRTCSSVKVPPSRAWASL